MNFLSVVTAADLLRLCQSFSFLAKIATILNHWSFVLDFFLNLLSLMNCKMMMIYSSTENILCRVTCYIHFSHTVIYTISPYVQLFNSYSTLVFHLYPCCFHKVVVCMSSYSTDHACL